MKKTWTSSKICQKNWWIRYQLRLSGCLRESWKCEVSKEMSSRAPTRTSCVSQYFAWGRGRPIIVCGAPWPTAWRGKIISNFSRLGPTWCHTARSLARSFSSGKTSITNAKSTAVYAPSPHPEGCQRNKTNGFFVSMQEREREREREREKARERERERERELTKQDRHNHSQRVMPWADQTSGRCTHYQRCNPNKRYQNPR